MQFHPMTARRAYACQGCGHHIYPAAGTIFNKSRTKLTIWFFAMYLMTSTRHGVAAKEIERQTGVTYKCAWRICHELRKLMASADARGPIGGPGKHVEIDETLVGGKLRHHGKGKHRLNKTTVFGIIERDGGRMVAGPVPDETHLHARADLPREVQTGTAVSTDGHNPIATLAGATNTAWSITMRRNTCAATITPIQSRVIGRC